MFYVNVQYARHYKPQFVYLKANVIYLLDFFFLKFCPVNIQERVIMARVISVWEIFFCILSLKQKAAIVVFGQGAGPWSVWSALKQAK